jgi:hypothetical protein
MTLNELPSLVNPKTDKEEPTLPNARSEIDEPRWK